MQRPDLASRPPGNSPENPGKYISVAVIDETTKQIPRHLQEYCPRKAQRITPAQKRIAHFHAPEKFTEQRNRWKQ